MSTHTFETQLQAEYSAPSQTGSAAQQSTRPDEEIDADVRRELRQDAVLKGTSDRIDGVVNGTVVYLSGYVPTSAHKARAETDVRRVQGVMKVENHLQADDELRVLVAQALTTDACLSHHLLEVRSTNGIIRLDGQVESADLATAAVCLAERVGGVRAVVNCLRWPGAAATSAQTRVLLPGIGQEVYASDGWLGSVERVIMASDSRRVTAIQVDAHCVRMEGYPERHIVIPVDIVRLVNASGVELSIAADEVARYSDFDPTGFVTPDPNWQGPYGYLPSEILLDSTASPAF